MNVPSLLRRDGIRPMLTGALAGALLGAWPHAALALTADEADCAVRKLPTGFFDEMNAASHRPDREAAVKSIVQALAAPVSECLAELKLPASSKDALTAYTLGTIGVSNFRSILAASHVPSDAIDAVLEIGPGRANPRREGLESADYRAISVELGRRGVAIERLSEQTWRVIDSYAAAATMLHAGRVGLGL